MLQAPLRLFRNLLFAVAKLLLVIGAAAVAIPEEWQVNAIIASWVIGQGLAALVWPASVGSGASAFGIGRGSICFRDWSGSRFWHYVLNVAAIAPSLILPLIIAVAAVAGTERAILCCVDAARSGGRGPDGARHRVVHRRLERALINGLEHPVLAFHLARRRRRRGGRVSAPVECGAQHLEPGCTSDLVGSDLRFLGAQRSADGRESSLHDRAAPRRSGAPGGYRARRRSARSKFCSQPSAPSSTACWERRRVGCSPWASRRCACGPRSGGGLAATGG